MAPTLKTVTQALLSLLSLAGTAYGYANPLTCTGVCTDTSDPALIRRSSDGEYFRFATGGEIAIYKAPSIKGPWVYQGAVVPAGSSIDIAGNTDLWAPDVTLVGSTYYLYYAVSTFGSQTSAIGYATSSTMEYGSWTDHGATGISSTSAKPYNAIDPHLVLSGSTYYMTLGSFWNDIYQVEMLSTPTKPASDVSSYQVAYDPASDHAEEGSFIYYNGGYYYLFYSHGQCCNYNEGLPAAGDEYMIKVCRSTSISGSYVDSNGVACTDGGGTIVLESHGNVYGPGGQGVYDDPTYGPVSFFPAHHPHPSILSIRPIKE
ncbi:glycoside hydrolase, family 43 [Xylariaceae sp. FL0255]|nr:glycoside hydrolase, family 43 [Xylariaceae sp. FL0255]